MPRAGEGASRRSSITRYPAASGPFAPQVLEQAGEGRTELLSLEVSQAGTVHALVRRGGVTGTLIVTLEDALVESYLRDREERISICRLRPQYHPARHRPGIVRH